jgi:histidinol-phosphate aminotransferase
MSAPVSRVDATSAYRRPARDRRGALHLDGNEGASPSASLLEALRALDAESLRRYPDASRLEAALAALHGVTPAQVIVTAGADEAIDRVCRAYTGPGRRLLLSDPTFEMLDRYAALAGAELDRVPWGDGPFPVGELLRRLDGQVGVIAVVSPNNPTGGVATLDDVRRLSAAQPGALILLDLAYVEYATVDPTRDALTLPNVVVVRTLSKAWGLAGCRIGYAMGPASIVATLRAAGGPYPVATPSVAIALAQLQRGEADVRAHVATIRAERSALTGLLATLGLTPRASEANFVFTQCGSRAPFIAQGLATLGVLVRAFPDRAGLTGALRITLPGNAGDFARLCDALRTVRAPEALLFDLDGVLADVRASQWAAIQRTARAFGVQIDATDVTATLRAGDAANDWLVTHRLMRAHGVDASLRDVVERYQRLYLGTDGDPGLRDQEQLIPSCATLERLAARLPLAIVTGRPRAEAAWFLERACVADLFRTVIAMEDAAAKPDPASVRLALERLGVRRAWMIGNSPDDVRAAAGAGVVPLGIVAPGDDPAAAAAALHEVGAATILPALDALTELLP